MTPHPTTTYTSPSLIDWPISTAITIPVHDKALGCAPPTLIETARENVSTKIWNVVFTIVLVVLAALVIMLALAVVYLACRRHRYYEDVGILYFPSRNSAVRL